MARQKTGYPGVFFKTVNRAGGRKGQTERSYYIIYKKNGKNIEEHVGYQFRDDLTPSRVSKIRGERIENKRRSRKDIRKAQEAKGWTFSKLWEHYVEHRKNNNKGEGPTHSDVSRYNVYIKDTIGEKRPYELKPSDLDSSIHELLRDRAPGTRYAALQMINRLSTYAKKQQLCEPIKFFIELPKVDITQTEMLTEEQFHKLIDTLDEDGGTVARMMKLALFTGLRKSEVRNLKWSDIDFENDILKVKGKSKKTNYLPLNDAAKAVLDSMVPASEFMFQEAQDRGGSWLMGEANHLKAAAGLPRDFRAFHGMRHSYASLLASSGVTLYTVSKLLTHSGTQMTQRYAHLSDKALKEASAIVSNAVEKGGKKT